MLKRVPAGDTIGSFDADYFFSTGYSGVFLTASLSAVFFTGFCAADRLLAVGITCKQAPAQRGRENLWQDFRYERGRPVADVSMRTPDSGLQYTVKRFLADTGTNRQDALN